MQDPNVPKPSNPPSTEPNAQPAFTANQPQAEAIKKPPDQEDDNTSESTSTPRTLVTIFFLLFFPLVGLILMFLITKWSKVTKVIITIIFTIYTLFSLFVLGSFVFRFFNDANESESIENCMITCLSENISDPLHENENPNVINEMCLESCRNN